MSNIVDAEAKYIVVTVFDQYEQSHQLFETLEAAQKAVKDSNYPTYLGELITTEEKPKPALKRFLLFSGDRYYPSGGWEDFLNSYDTEMEAMAAAFDNHREWYQIVDTETGRWHQSNR